MRLGQIKIQKFNCLVLSLESACDVCPPVYYGLNLSDVIVKPKGASCDDWLNCNEASSSSSYPSKSYLDVFLKPFGDNWVRVEKPQSSSSSGVCACMRYSQYSPDMGEIKAGPFQTESECLESKCFSPPPPPVVYCIDMSTYNPMLHEICAGPYQSQAECGSACNPSSSSSSSSTYDCIPVLTVVTLPDGSKVIRLECQSSSTTERPNSSSASCDMSSPPPAQGVFCDNGYRVGSVFFVPNFGDCSWTPVLDITDVCPSSSSSKSDSCIDNIRCCLYSDAPNNLMGVIFAALEKPPPCPEYRDYCLADGCETRCRDDSQTSVESCKAILDIRPDCCGRGVCVTSCVQDPRINCINCLGSDQRWFPNGVGVDQYIQQTCYITCWECDQVSGTCVPVTYTLQQRSDVAAAYGLPVTDVGCGQIASYYGNNSYSSPAECASACGCCCDSEGYPDPNATNQSECSGSMTQGNCSSNPCGGCKCKSVTLSPPKKLVVTNGSSVSCLDVDYLRCGGGICCRPDGTCSTFENTKQKCEAIGGTWKGDFNKCSKCACTQCPPLDGCSIRVRRESRSPDREGMYPIISGYLDPAPSPIYDALTDSCVINVTVGQDVFWCTDANGNFRIVGEDIDQMDCSGPVSTCETNITATVDTSGTSCKPRITSQQATGPCQIGSPISIEIACAYATSAMEEPINLGLGMISAEASRKTKLTRNNYGATVANVEDIMFLDVDVVDQKNRTKAYGRLKEYLSSTSQTFRVYETAGGFRAICTSRNFEPDSVESLKIMKDSWTDRKYVSFCKSQKCFRIRLTPKPWRIGVNRLPEQYPRSQKDQAEFESWLDDYEKRSGMFSVCRFLDTVGDPDASKPDILSFVEFHDEATRCFMDLPLEPLSEKNRPNAKTKSDSVEETLKSQSEPSTARELYAYISTPCGFEPSSTKVFFSVSGNCDCSTGQGCEASMTRYESDCPTIVVENYTGPRSWNCTYNGIEDVCDNSGECKSLEECSDCVPRFECDPYYACASIGFSRDASKLTYCDESNCSVASYECAYQGCQPIYGNTGKYKGATAQEALEACEKACVRRHNCYPYEGCVVEPFYSDTLSVLEQSCDYCVSLGWVCGASTTSSAACTEIHGYVGSSWWQPLTDKATCETNCKERFECRDPYWWEWYSPAVPGCYSIGPSVDTSKPDDCSKCGTYWYDCASWSLSASMSGQGGGDETTCQKGYYYVDDGLPKGGYDNETDCKNSCSGL